MGFVEAKWALDNIVKEVFFATITVNTNKGANVSFTKGSFSETVACPTGTCIYKARELGEWTVKIEKSGVSETNKVIVNGWGSNVIVKLSVLSIYGIKRDTNTPSTTWTRTDDSVGKTATASVGTQAGHSDFSDCYPWSEMKRQTIGGDVMVKIPEFWYKRWLEGSVEHIQIADKQINGFSKHPGSGRYIAAYKTSQNNRSLSGQMPTVNQTRGTMRNNAKSKGSGWGIIDLMTWNAIQMLYLVEFADNDSQETIGRGYVDSNSSARATGGCDGVPNFTGRASGTDGKTDIVYRGIEGIWGNVNEWLDGIVSVNLEWWVCTNPNSYADGSTSGHTRLSYEGGNSSNYSGCIKKMGVDSSNAWAMLASEYGGSTSTYYSDYGYCNHPSNVCHPIVGGAWSYGSAGGLFRLDAVYGSSYSASHLGARLLYTPS